MVPGNGDLQKILSMEIYDGYLYTKGTYIDWEGNPKLFYLRTRYDAIYETLSEIIKNQKDTFSYVERRFDLCEQNAMEYLVKSNSFSGKLEEYRQQGYEISVVSSAAGELNTYGALTAESTLKLQKVNEIKYVTVSYSISIKNPTGNPKIDYTLKLADPDGRRINLDNFVELSGDLYKFAQEMERVNSLINDEEA